MKGIKMSRKVVLGAVVSAVVASGVGALMLTNSKTVSADETRTVVSNAKNELSTALMDETVYVFLSADGEVKKTISSDWTKNDLGTDVYTKTEGKVSTPITMEVSYYLDGRKVSADEIRGRSGHIKIRYDYINNERVNGMYMPYAVVSGAVLSDEHFSNISVTNGKAINDGTRTTVVGIALPGMREDLGVAIDIPEYVEIEADAKDFKMEMTATLASSQIFTNVDTSALDSVSSLSSQLDLLASSMNQLLNGSVQIRDGLATLNSKTGALVDGVSQLKVGSSALVEYMNMLTDGLGQIADGSGLLATKIGEVAAGAKLLDDSVGEAANEVASSMSDLSSNSKAIVDTANVFISGTIKKLANNPLLQGITVNDYEAKIESAIGTLTAMGKDDDAEELKTILRQLRFYQETIKYANRVVLNLSALPTKLSTLKGYTADLANGLPILTEKTTNLSNKLFEVAGKAGGITDGMTNLDAGISDLAGGIPNLTDGVYKLANGSSSLADGLAQFNEQGVQKLVALYNGNIKALIERIQTIVNLAKNSGSKTKYIYRTSEI